MITVTIDVSDRAERALRSHAHDEGKLPQDALRDLCYVAIRKKLTPHLVSQGMEDVTFRAEDTTPPEVR